MNPEQPASQPRATPALPLEDFPKEEEGMRKGEAGREEGRKEDGNEEEQEEQQKSISKLGSDFVHARPRVPEASDAISLQCC